MSELGNRIVEEARTWKGTRYQNQGRLKGLGVDCVGFISEVAKGAGIKSVSIPNDYASTADGTVMLQLLSEHMEMVPTEEMQAGDVLALYDEALHDPDIPRHLVFVTDVTPRAIFIIHASERGVTEHRVNSYWLKRVHSVWRIIE